jgi:MFS transporter, PHS family, inorganic phosphate transporter
MGVGIGGDYPLSAIIVSEFSPIHIRGRLMTAVVASQGWGNFGVSFAGSATSALI